MKFNLTIAIILVLSLAFFDVTNAAFCDDSNLDLADGTQNAAGACVDVEMGELPSKENMVSAIITAPKFGARIKVNTAFPVTVKILNLETGFFSDPATTYYQQPQKLNGGGIIQGHSHVTIQKVNVNSPPDPKIFAFFKGLNNKAVNGALSVTVEAGLKEPGLYRICTMNSANTHQAVLMPVAQRGAQDDCIRVIVVA